MELSSSNNFYIIQNNSIQFWGMDIHPINVELNKVFIEFFEMKQLLFNEVVEISELEDDGFYELIKNNNF
jgi:beta-galactosidase GanA